MRIKSQLLMLILFVVCNSLAAQEIKKPIKKVVIEDFSVHLGVFTAGNNHSTLSQFKSLAPQSEILKDNYSSYVSGGYFLTNKAMLAMLAGFKLNTKNKHKPELRLGFNYMAGSGLALNIYQSKRTPYDTLTSDKTNQKVYVDSVTNRYRLMQYSSKQVRIDASIIFRSDIKKRWMFYTGIGATLGLAFSAHTKIYSNDASGFAIQSNYGYIDIGYLDQLRMTTDSKYETFRNKNSLVVSAYIPLGINFRIGNKGLLRQTHLFYELRPGVNITNIPELHRATNVMLQQCLVLMFSWN